MPCSVQGLFHCNGSKTAVKRQYRDPDQAGAKKSPESRNNPGAVNYVIGQAKTKHISRICHYDEHSPAGNRVWLKSPVIAPQPPCQFTDRSPRITDTTHIGLFSIQSEHPVMKINAL